MILCDIGNSYFHFFYRNRIWREESNRLSPKSESVPIYYISVNPRSEKKLLESHKNCINAEPFINLDTIYQGLGVDRKAACLAVDNGIIVDCGSAITIDIMQEGIHLGGYILPGINLFKKMFSNIDALKMDFNLDVSLQAIPQNTRDALSYGCIKSIILAIQDIARDNYIYFTGGDGKYLSRFFNQSIFDNTLVFKGMTKAINSRKLGATI